MWDLPGVGTYGTETYVIRVFIVTYNSPDVVHENLKSFFSSQGFPGVKCQVNIINNHPNFTLAPEYHDSVLVHDNSLRLKSSVGHLARDWNAALMIGFEDLAAPKCHQVICVHDDVIWHPDWLPKLMDIHNNQKYTFYAGNFGCSFMSFKPEAVRKVGLFDERFCNIGFHEADYFLRQLIYNREHASINDVIQGRVVNPTTQLFDHPPYTPSKVDSREESSLYHCISRNIFSEKWNLNTDRWAENGVLDNPPKYPLIDSYIYYPKFELELYKKTLDDQKYQYAVGYRTHWYDNWTRPRNQFYQDLPGLRWNMILTDDTVQVIQEIIPKWTWADTEVLIRGRMQSDVSEGLTELDKKLAIGGPLEWMNVPV
jgi:hypothetical protein